MSREECFLTSPNKVLVFVPVTVCRLREGNLKSCCVSDKKKTEKVPSKLLANREYGPFTLKTCDIEGGKEIRDFLIFFGLSICCVSLS